MTPAPDKDLMASLPEKMRAALRRRVAPPTIVLLYHRVLPTVDRDVNELVTSVDHFAAHLKWLAENTRPLRPREFLKAACQTTRSTLNLDGKPRAVITFDDGYADNFHHALPVLVDAGFSAAVFAVTGAISTGAPFWWDALETIVFDGKPDGDAWRMPDGTVVAHGADRAATYRTMHAVLKPMAEETRANVLTDLAWQGGVAPPAADEDSRPMSWEELRAWAAAGMTVGAHTRSHAPLAGLAPDALRDELMLSKRDLEKHLGIPVEMLAYPYGGRNDVGAQGEEAARAAGFRCAFANRIGNARWARSPFAVPRCLVRNWSVDQFRARFQGWCDE